MAISKAAMLIAGAHFVVLASPSTALAQAAPPAAPMTAPMPAAPPSAPSTAAPGMVRVMLAGSDVAELQQDTTGDHRHWVTVCSAPCDRVVDARFSYRIVGDGIRNSRVFSLSTQSDRETITVDEGSKAGFVAGILGVSVGSVVMVTGFFVLLVNALSGLGADGDGTPGGGSANTEAIGWAVSGAGLAGIIGGTVAIVSNARTGVTQGAVSSQAGSLPSWLSSPSTLEPSNPPGYASKDVFGDARRDAAWAAALPPAVGVPLFGGRF
jgi:hypothetical protein